MKRNSVSHTSDRTLKYMKQLSYEKRLKLYQIYKVDFQLFGYDANPYLKRVLWLLEKLYIKCYILDIII